MAKPVTFRLNDDKLDRLDQLAASLDRDRSYLLSEAVDHYLDLHQWQVDQILQAIADADAGKFASEEEVEAAFAAFRTTP